MQLYNVVIVRVAQHVKCHGVAGRHALSVSDAEGEVVGPVYQV